MAHVQSAERPKSPKFGLKAEQALDRLRLRAALRDGVGSLQLSRQEIEAHSIDVYLAPNPVLRTFFWRRIDYLRDLAADLRSAGTLGSSAIDLGGGSGIVSATLAQFFSTVTLLDRDTRLARHVLATCRVRNTILVEADALEWDGPAERVPCLIAADVLEHFQDLPPIIDRLRSWLMSGGVLLTSLPTENLVYQALRIPFGKSKPADHYHNAASVERELSSAGFTALDRRYHPCGLNIFPLFRITAWRAP